MGTRGLSFQSDADAPVAAVPWRRALGAALAALAVIAVLIPGQFADPFMRNDDFLAHFPLPDLAWENTLTEGRWGNQLWTWRGVPGERHVLFVLAMAIWTLASGAIAARLFAVDPSPWRTAVFAIALALAPQAAMLLPWYNFNIPANLALLAGVSILAAAPERTVLIGLPVLVFAALATYPPHAFMLFAVALAFGAATMTLARFMRLAAALVSGAVIGLVALYSINARVHGHFGLLLADWRGARMADDLGGLIANIGRLGLTLPEGAPPGAEAVALALLMALPIVALIMALQPSRPVWFRTMLAGAALTLLLALAQSLKTGAMLPNRATGFLWAFAVLALALGAREGSGRTARLCTLGALAMALGGAVAWHQAHTPGIAAYQTWTRALAAEAARPNSKVLLVTGPLDAYAEAAVLNEFVGFEFRLEDLTGLDVRYCPAYAGPPVDAAPFHPAARPRIEHRNAGIALCEAHRAALDAMDKGTATLAPGVVGLRL